MKNFDFQEGWQRFLHWPGWSALYHWKGWTAWLHWSGWKSLGHWKGWKSILFPHPLLVLLLTVLSAAGLGWIFFSGREQTLLAYPIYCLATYSLTTLVITIAKNAKLWTRKFHDSALSRNLLQDENRMFLLTLFREEIVNLLYGLFKLVSGVLLGSFWQLADGLYNLTQGLIQLLQLILHRKHLPMEQQWKSYRFCGWMILVMHLTMIGVMFQMIFRGEAEEYPGYMIFATAAFTFYKLISAIVDVAKDRKHSSPVDASVRMLELTQALFSIFSLQVALLHVFADTTINQAMMNSLTGCTVSLMVLGTGVYMIRRANRDMKGGQNG